MRKFLFTATIGLALVGVSLARLLPSYLTEEQLMARSDLIVTALPMRVRDTHEQTTIPGIWESARPDQERHAVRAVKMEADFKILTVLKGTPPVSKQLTLDYLREAGSPKASLDGLGLVSFDPTKEIVYRLCLKKDENGHYSAMTGQTDPDLSITVWK
ncbi:hypothetical protein BH09VER1_BH09VER1_44240 [soil metagenome]